MVNLPRPFECPIFLHFTVENLGFKGEANPRSNIRLARDVPPTPALATTFSVFVDAGCCNGGPTVWGLTVCNQIGEVILSKCNREDIDVGPLLAEALGVCWAVQVAMEEGLNSVSICSDAANVYQWEV